MKTRANNAHAVTPVPFLPEFFRADWDLSRKPVKALRCTGKEGQWGLTKWGVICPKGKTCSSTQLLAHPHQAPWQPKTPFSILFVILSTSHAYHSTQHIISTSIIAELNSVSSLLSQFLKREERGISSFLGPLPNPYYTTGTMQGMILCYFVDPHRANEETILWVAKWLVSQPSELSEFTPSPSDSQFHNWESL